MYKLLLIFLSFLLMAGCFGQYDPSIHNDVITTINEKYEDLLYLELDQPVTVSKLLKNKVEDPMFGKVHKYSLTVYLKPKDGIYTREELWDIAVSIANERVLVGLHGKGKYEGIFNNVHVVIGDSTASVYANVHGKTKVNGDTFESFFVSHYDDNGKPHYHAGYPGGK